MIDFVKAGVSWLNVDMVRNEVQHIITAPDPAVYPDRSGLRYYLDVEVPEYPQSSNYQKLIRLEGREKPVTTSDGGDVYEGCTFRLESLLAGKVSFQLPEKGQTNLSIIATLTSPYQLREIIEPAIKNTLNNSRVCIRAGLALRDFVGYGHQFFSRNQAEKMQFLTWQKPKKTIGGKQEEFLYFLMNLSPLPTTINLRAQITYSNGTTEVVTKKTLDGALAYQVICAPVGPLALGLTAENVVKYEVWLSDENLHRFSEVRCFFIDRRKHRYERSILFANSFGGFDTLRLLGKSSEQSDVTKATAAKERETGQGLQESELAIISIKENSGIEVSTGLIEEDRDQYMRYLRELLLSECILEDTEWGFEALNLITSNLVYRQDDAGLVERTFQFRRTYSDINFSNLKAVPAVATRATDWRGVGSVYLLDAYGKRTGFIKAAALRKYYIDDGSDVVPLTQKPNVEGDRHFIAASPDPSVVPGSTPFPNAAISKPGTFLRNNCPAGEDGMVANITIVANTYGGEKAGVGNALAETAWNRLNTQDYANQYGSCAVAQNYGWNVPVGHFHYRSNMPAKVGVYQVNGSFAKGNIQAVQGRNEPYIFPVGSNDLDFPAEIGWYYYIYGSVGQKIRVEIYRDGILMKTETANFTTSNSANSYFFDDGGLNLYAPVSGNKFLIKLTIL